MTMVAAQPPDDAEPRKKEVANPTRPLPLLLLSPLKLWTTVAVLGFLNRPPRPRLVYTS
jgi:hypothetical protein